MHAAALQPDQRVCGIVWKAVTQVMQAPISDLARVCTPQTSVPHARQRHGPQPRRVHGVSHLAAWQRAAGRAGAAHRAGRHAAR